MDTKSLIIEKATKLFQQKGYLGVGLSEILKACNVSKGALYHHFPNGKEELLIVCLQSLNEAITKDMETIFQHHSSTLMATQAAIEKLADQFDEEGKITGYTFSSIVSEMGALNEAVRNACASPFTRMQEIYNNKLVEDGFSNDMAHSMALMLTAAIEGGILLCLTHKTSNPLRTISQVLPILMKES